MLTNVLAASGSPADRHETWDPRLTYVVGHQRPDTDAIASALGYAWFLSHTGHAHVRAARAGQPGDQAVFALKRFDQAAPPLLRAVAPTFGHIAGACPTVLPDAKLAEAMALLAEGAQVVPVVDAEGRPLGVVTPLALARVYSQSMSGDNGGVGTTRRVRAVIASAPLFTPALLCHEIAEALPTFRAGERISDYRTPLVRSDSNQYLVVDAAGRYVGLATQRSVLQPPRARLILVDHNELGQAVVGADEAEIVGVLDHHRLGNPPTAAPIPFVVDPVGSTSTLVAEACEADDLVPPPGIAGMLLSGILSDTLVFRSPTAGARDRAMAAWLAGLCGVDDIARFGDELLRASPGFGARTADEIVDADRKRYEMGAANLPVSVAQVEVTGGTGTAQLAERRPELLAALETRREREHLALACLMVTDVVTGRSRLVCAGDARILAGLPFARTADGEWDLGDMVSRKKQLVPALMSVIESVL